MIELYHDLPTEIEYEGVMYRLKLTFDNVLRCLSLRDDTAVPDELRIPWLADCLIVGGTKLSVQKQAVIVKAIFSEYIYFSKRRGNSQPTNTKSFDFKFDADLIYSSFMQAYKIDLIQEQGYLHWWKFYSLFLGLPKDTKMREVMAIRQKPMPTPNKHNQEEIRSLQEAKQYYALPGINTGKTYQEGLQSLWSALEKQVKT